MIFQPKTLPDLAAVAKNIQRAIKAPYVLAQGSSLGGLHRASVIVRLSLDPKTKWTNGIFHNSRYALFHLHNDGSLELFSKGYDMPKMRKAKATGIPDAVRRINEYIAKAKKV